MEKRKVKVVVPVYKPRLEGRELCSFKHNAEVLAGAIEQEIGPCTYIHDYNSNGDVYFSVNRAMKSRAYAMDSATEGFVEESEPMEFAETTISHTIQAKFQLLP